MRLKNPKISPSGHIYLQKALFSRMKQIMKKIVRAVFHQKVSPIVALKPEFAAIIGIPATISPDGQIYAQKPWASPKDGIIRTKNKRLNHFI